jgi:hypothetical protein
MKSANERAEITASVRQGRSLEADIGAVSDAPVGWDDPPPHFVDHGDP